MSQTTVESPATWITGAVVLDPDIGSTSRADVLIRADRIAEVVPATTPGPPTGPRHELTIKLPPAPGRSMAAAVC